MRVRRAIAGGLAVWAVTIAAAVSAAPIKASNRLLFESIMPVALSAVIVLAAVLYFRCRPGGIAEGAAVGAIWLAINLGLDGLMFSSGPMKMDVGAYVQDIGLTYLIIPIVTTGIGWARVTGFQMGGEAAHGGEKTG
jgi:hypothetical protein